MVIREWRQRPVVRAGWAACALVFGIIATATGIGGGLSASTWASGLTFAAIGGVIGAIVLRMAWRIVGARVVISTQAVTVAGPLRTRVIPLTEADRFAARNTGNQPTIVLLRHNGLPWVWCWIFNRNGAIWQFNRLLQELQPTVEELNQALDAARSGVQARTHSTRAQPRKDLRGLKWVHGYWLFGMLVFVGLLIDAKVRPYVALIVIGVAVFVSVLGAYGEWRGRRRAGAESH